MYSCGTSSTIAHSCCCSTLAAWAMHSPAARRGSGSRSTRGRPVKGHGLGCDQFECNGHGDGDGGSECVDLERSFRDNMPDVFALHLNRPHDLLGRTIRVGRGLELRDPKPKPMDQLVQDCTTRCLRSVREVPEERAGIPFPVEILRPDGPCGPSDSTPQSETTQSTAQSTTHRRHLRSTTHL